MNFSISAVISTFGFTVIDLHHFTFHNFFSFTWFLYNTSVAVQQVGHQIDQRSLMFSTGMTRKCLRREISLCPSLHIFIWVLAVCSDMLLLTSTRRRWSRCGGPAPLQSSDCQFSPSAFSSSAFQRYMIRIREKALARWQQTTESGFNRVRPVLPTSYTCYSKASCCCRKSGTRP